MSKSSEVSSRLALFGIFQGFTEYRRVDAARDQQAVRVAKDCIILLAFTIPDMNFGPREQDMRADKPLLRDYSENDWLLYRAVFQDQKSLWGLRLSLEDAGFPFQSHAAIAARLESNEFISEISSQQF